MARAPRRSRDAEATRAAILDAARDRFAAEGFENATIRAIAEAAGIDPALVMRYFGSKDKLFAAAADFDLRLPDLSAVPKTRIGTRLAEHFVDRWEADDTFIVLLRAAATNDDAAKRMRGVLAGQVGPALARFATDAPMTRIALVSSQLLGFALGRYVLRVPPLVEMSRDEIVSALGPTLQRYITGAL
jgi:AcrR family transcriptional regulator